MRRTQTLLAASLFALPLFAQAPVVEKIDVNVVNVDVTVTDRAGNPVRGLTRDDFEVFEDGKLQKISNFYAVENLDGRAEARPISQEERFRRKVLVIVDNVTTTRFNRDRALDRLEQFVNDHFVGGDYDWSLALFDRRAHLLLAPTSDKREVFKAIGEIRRLVAGDMARLTADNRLEPLAINLTDGVGTSVNDLACAGQRLSGMLAEGDRIMLAATESNSAAALTQAVRGFSTVSGKKIVLLLTSDAVLKGPIVDPLAITGCAPPGTLSEVVEAHKNHARLSEYLIREANASNVSLYIINAEGFRAGGWEKMLGVQGETTEIFTPPTDNAPLYWLARETGGRLLPGNDVADSLKTFDAVSSNFYSLGYRPTHGEDDKYHRINLRLKRPGSFHLQYRDGYSSFASQERITRLLQSPIAPAMQPSSLPVQIAVGTPERGSKGELLVPISAAIPRKNLTFLPDSAAPVEIYFSLFDASGRNVALLRFDRQAKAGEQESFVERHALRLKKGEPYRVVVAIRDPLTDALGIAQQAVKF